jgi:hypothetical protein
MFKIHKDTKNWSKNILSAKGSPFETQLDLYYLFFIVGIGQCKSPNYDKEKVTDIIRNYTTPFQAYREVYAALLLVSEIENSGLEMNKELVSKKMENILSTYDSTILSDNSFELMNQYAFGGFELIREEWPKAPPNSHDFLKWYYDVMLQQCFTDKDWK